VEIIQHVVELHHRAIGEHLHRLDGVFHELEQCCGLDDATCRRAMTAFDTLKDGVRQCMTHEKCVVFPQIERWCADSRGVAPGTPSEVLVKAANDLAQWHARLFTQSCRLVRRVRDLEQGPIERPLLMKLQSAAADFCDDFDQQLFEEDCLLLPRITNWQAPREQSERQPCPPC
jgi:iron-sulfur cluster repair protein YtfE (RIC family)